MKKQVSIAIDGPSGAGKSTIARRVAAELSFVYVDTGAMYRAIGLYAYRKGVAHDDGPRIKALLPEIRISLSYKDGEQRIFLNGEDVSEAIRAHEISKMASGVSAFREVRAFLLDLQRDMAKKHNVVMDGRDIGTVVLPGAQIKIFLTASPEDRAGRRHQELLKKGEHIPFEQVLRDVTERDKSDSTREEAPLRQAGDALLVDTTGNTKEQSIALLTKIIKERLKDVL